MKINILSPIIPTPHFSIKTAKMKDSAAKKGEKIKIFKNPSVRSWQFTWSTSGSNLKLNGVSQLKKKDLACFWDIRNFVKIREFSYILANFWAKNDWKMLTIHFLVNFFYWNLLQLNELHGKTLKKLLKMWKMGQK